MISISSKQFQNPSNHKNSHLVKQPSKTIGVKKRLNYVILAMILTFILWILMQVGALGFVKTSFNQLWQNATYHAGFRLQYVYLNHKDPQNESLTSETFGIAKQEILQAIGLENQKAGQVALMALSPQKIKDDLDSLPWVKSSSVKKILPDSLYLTIEPRQPFVIVETEDKTLVYDSLGNALPIHPSDASDNLLRLAGKGAFEASVELLNIVADSSDLFSEIALAKRISMRRWDIYLKNGLLVKMPENHSTYAWQEITKLARQDDLFTYNVKIIDLRVDDRVTLQGKNAIIQ